MTQRLKLLTDLGLKIILLAVLSFLSEISWAKRLDLRSGGFATYFRGTYGPSRVLKTPFEHSSGSTTYNFDHTISTNWGAEFGLLITTSSRYNIRLGAEALIPSHYKEILGTDINGNNLFTLDSSVQGLIPTAYVDLVLFEFSNARFYFGGGVGYAYVKVQNNYKFTDDGNLAYQLPDFYESFQSEKIAYQAYLGYEAFLVDNVTIAIDAGYRFLPVDNFRHLLATTTFLGPVQKGDLVVKSDGTQRTINLSGFFAGLSLRFFINF